MSTTVKSAIFLAITFAVTWGIVIAGWNAGLHEGNPQIAVAVLAASMVGPTIAALICMIAFEKGQRIKSLGLGGRWSLWWFAAPLVPIALAGASVALTLLLSDRTYVDIGAASADAAAAAAQGQDISELPAFLLSTPFIIGMSILVGGLINWLVLTFTEELGWRGYLHYLWRPAGFWRASLGTGVFWGIWHAPMIYLFGHNYPDDRVLGVGLFVVFCMLLSPIMTLIRDRTNSVWSAGLFHGMFNAVGGLTVAALSNPTFPWNGIVGIGGFIALAVGFAVVLLLQRPTKEAL